MKILTYDRLMRIGRSSGCHQIPERSFFIRGKQFPVCARCTGVMIGNVVAYVLFFLYAMPQELCILGCGVIFLDWYVQFIGIRESTNIRRLVTGIIGGFSLATLYCTAIKCVVQLVLL